MASASLGADALGDGGSTGGNLDGGVRILDIKPSVLDGPEAAAGVPKTGGFWVLWGGGATLTPGPVRVQMAAWRGTLAASTPGSSSVWDLGLAAITVEQAYPWNSFLFTAGISAEAGQLDGTFIRDGASSSVDALLLGGSTQVGVRWPAQTALGLFARAGWELLSGPGTWHGASAGSLGSERFDFGGPTATLQLELSL